MYALGRKTDQTVDDRGLPAMRVHQCRPFARVGIDFAGPLQMREPGLRKSRIFKIYIAVFVCFTVKAVLLKVVSDLSTSAFFSAFNCFVARRGLPSDVFTDCGMNFDGANKQLHALINSPDGQIAIANSRVILGACGRRPCARQKGC